MSNSGKFPDATQQPVENLAQNGLADKSLRTPAYPPQKLSAAKGEAINSATNRIAGSSVIHANDTFSCIKIGGWVIGQNWSLNTDTDRSVSQSENSTRSEGGETA